jgi:CHAT domain-containing protein
MQPIPTTGDLPHITWCTTGPLSFLPIHASGCYDKPQAKLFDFVISSYTPTLSALLPGASSPARVHSGILTISQEATPGQSRLPGTVAELACFKKHVQAPLCYTQLANHQATTAAVLAGMEQHDWVHLACHASQNVQNPTESGFFLHDGTLSLSKITQRSFKDKGLAFLSACQTATGDKELPEEAVHLASGMVMAGYPSVIATMWSIKDEDAPVIADAVYSQLLKNGGMDVTHVAKALHFAVGDLRRKVGDKSFERWVPYIHIGV